MKQHFLVFVISFSCLSLAHECGKDFGSKNPTETVSNLKQFPSLAHISAIEEGRNITRNIGKAILISPFYLLTVAVNVIHDRIKPINVVLGEQNLNTPIDCDNENPKNCADPPVTVDIEEITVHPEYVKSKFGNDIALIKLKDPVSYSEYIQPICLPKQNEVTNEGDLLYLATFSNIVPYANNHNGVKKTLILPVRNFEECAKNITRLSRGKITDWNKERLLCAGSEGRDGCRGDSGSALMKQNSEERWTAIGLLSFGPTRCGLADAPSVYTRIANYVDWIENIAFKS